MVVSSMKSLMSFPISVPISDRFSSVSLGSRLDRILSIILVKDGCSLGGLFPMNFAYSSCWLVTFVIPRSTCCIVSIANSAGCSLDKVGGSMSPSEIVDIIFSHSSSMLVSIGSGGFSSSSLIVESFLSNAPRISSYPLDLSKREYPRLFILSYGRYMDFGNISVLLAVEICRFETIDRYALRVF